MRDDPAFAAAGCEDLNGAAVVAMTGILFMEGESEPPEITAMKVELAGLAATLSRTSGWLMAKMDCVVGAPLADGVGRPRRARREIHRCVGVAVLVVLHLPLRGQGEAVFDNGWSRSRRRGGFTGDRETGSAPLAAGRGSGDHQHGQRE